MGNQRIMRSRTNVIAVALLLVSLVWPAMPASAHTRPGCTVGSSRAFCEHTHPGGGTPPANPFLVFDKGWGSWSPGSTLCDGVAGGEGRPRIIRNLYWLEGPAVPGLVTTTDFGHSYGSGDIVPNAPLTSGGDPARFGAEGWVWDTGCGGTLVEDLYESVSESLPEPEFGTNPAGIGITGLETWLWYDGAATSIPSFGMEWTDPITGIDYELEARAEIAQYVWDMGDGTTISSPVPGSGDDLPYSKAAGHTYETKGFYDVTLTVTWTGEFRWRTVGDPWPAWQPMTGTWSPSITQTYQVDQIVSRNTG